MHSRDMLLGTFNNRMYQVGKLTACDQPDKDM